jgi:DNA-directed RNA polymerase subunit H (RpoH/RPB5)
MVNTNTSIISQIYQSRKTILELMNEQGFDVTGYSNFSVTEVNAMKQNNQLDMLLESKNTSSSEKSSNKKKTYIRYYLAKTIRPINIHEMIDDLFMLTETLKKEDTLYIIIKDNVNETLINELKDIWERDGIFIVIENIKCLQFNILKHILVPPHHVINNDFEIENIMKKYNIIDKIQFPDISRFDPVARAICLRPGQLCNIIRPSKTAIESNYYRICI